MPLQLSLKYLPTSDVCMAGDSWLPVNHYPTFLGQVKLENFYKSLDV